MKKTALFLLVCSFLFAGCSSSQSLQVEEALASPNNLTMQEPTENVIFHYAYENWEMDQLSDFLHEDLVQTEESAIAIANAIVQSVIGEQEWKRLALTNVWEDVERNVWIVSYDPVSEDTDSIMTGGRVNIAIRKHDAQVLKMWAEE